MCHERWALHVVMKRTIFTFTSFIAILAGDHPSESVKVRHSPLASENLTNNQQRFGNGARNKV